MDYIQCVTYIKTMQWFPSLNDSAKIATVLIAFFNLFFAYKVFNFNKNKNADDKEKDRKIEWLNTLIISYNFKYFYAFFEELSIELSKLKNSELTLEDKRNIEDDISDLFVFLRQKFIDLLLAVDDDLYVSILDSFDTLQGNISSSIFDDGINLDHEPKFNECFEKIVNETKTDIIKKLFDYRG